MIDQKKVNEAVSCLVSVYSPLAIYLFGSYAWGHPEENSDLDLLIIIEKSEEKTYLPTLSRRISCPFWFKGFRRFLHPSEPLDPCKLIIF